MRRGGRAVQVMVSVPTAARARTISSAVLEQRLCACAQTLGPMTSRYRWKGKLESAREYLLVLKSSSARLAALEKLIVKLHPYDTPEILVVPIVAGHAAYLDWLVAESKPARKSHSASRRRTRSPR